MAVDRVRPRWYFVGRATHVVRVVNFMDRFVMPVLEDRKLALMRVETTEAVVVGLLGEDGRQNRLRRIFGNGIKVVFLQGTGAARSVTATTCMGFRYSA